MRKIVKNQLTHWLPVYVWAVLIFYFSLTPLTGSVASSLEKSFMFPDYYNHVLGYGFLTFLVWRAFQSSKLRYPGFFSVMAAIGYGAIIELNQYFIPGRNPSVFDFFFNLAGCIIVQPFIIFYKKFPKGLKKKKISL